MMSFRGKLLLVSCFSCPFHVLAQCEVEALIQSDRDEYSGFGLAVSIGGDVSVVGATDEDCGRGINCGAAYVFRFDGSSWVEEQKIFASDAAGHRGFGVSVSVYEDVLIVGDVLTNCDSGIHCGAAYIFRYDGNAWNEEQKLVASDTFPHDYFGQSVSISNGVAIVGASRRSAGGAAYIYRFNGDTWAEEERLSPPGSSYFGDDVVVDESVALVGAYVTNFNNGAAYFYRFQDSAWREEQKIVRPHEENFGLSIALDNAVAIIASELSAYAYRHDNSWIEEQELDLSDGVLRVNSVAVGGSLALVAVTELVPDNPKIARSTLYFFEHDGISWYRRSSLQSNDFSTRSSYGYALSMNGDGALSSGFHYDCETNGASCTRAHVFALGPDCDKNGQADFCDIRDGGAGDGDADGVPDECELVASLNIMPRKCPNRMKARSRGVIRAALAGSKSFDVTLVDVETLELRRNDWLGEPVQPLLPKQPQSRDSAVASPSQRHTRNLRIRDEATFQSDQACHCGEDGPDGFDDLVLRFDARQLSEAFELDGEENGASIDVTLSGAMMDGTLFEASDCIVIRGRD